MSRFYRGKVQTGQGSTRYIASNVWMVRHRLGRYGCPCVDEASDEHPGTPPRFKGSSVLAAKIVDRQET